MGRGANAFYNMLLPPGVPQQQEDDEEVAVNRRAQLDRLRRL